MLEDHFGDIVGKARYGKGLSLDALAGLSGLSDERLSALEEGRRPTGKEVDTLAPLLDLDGKRLRDIAEEKWHPRSLPKRIEEWVYPLQGYIGSYPVWGYLLFDRGLGEAVLIDTAYDPIKVLKTLDQQRLRLACILLTHAHMDHIGGLREIQQATNATVYIHPNEEATLGKPLRAGDHPVQEGALLEMGEIKIRALSTPGHTEGGTSYLFEERGIAFVGDALFAGSVGRSRSPQSYLTLISGIQKKILSLPEQTLLFPGHGPATTVGEEKQHNPFFPTLA